MYYIFVSNRQVYAIHDTVRPLKLSYHYHQLTI
jgi:hypothetical protein